MERTKVCTKCGVEKPFTSAFFHSNGKGKLRPDCAECSTERLRRYRASDPEAEKARCRAYYQRNPEKKKACSRAWEIAHPEMVAEHTKRYREKYPERVSARHRSYALAHPDRMKAHTKKWRENHAEHFAQVLSAWQKANPEKVRAACQNRRARIRGNGGTHSAEDLLNMVLAQGGRCFYCAKPLGADFHTDHKQPLARGGSNAVENLAAACPSCNLSKGTKTADEFMAVMSA
jgi:5-methylcytosine-specific restriction endonuclease McrA